VSVEKFLELRGWADELSAEERRPIDELFAEAAGAGTRLVPYGHGFGMPPQLHAGERRFLECKDPFCLIRIGDCEIGLLGAGFVPIHHDLNTQFGFAGFSRKAFPLRKDFISAVREAELLGLQQNWAPITVKTAMLLYMLGMPLPAPTGVEAHLPYQLLIDGTLFRYLAGKKVIFIGSTAWRLSECFKVKGFLDAYSFLGPIDQLKVAGVIQTKPREAGGAWADYERVLGEAARMDFDVALLACGGTAKPLAWRIWQSGKTALDVGFVFDVLMGNVEREHRPVLKDVVWPKFP